MNTDLVRERMRLAGFTPEYSDFVLTNASQKSVLDRFLEDPPKVLDCPYCHVQPIYEYKHQCFSCPICKRNAYRWDEWVTEKLEIDAMLLELKFKPPERLKKLLLDMLDDLDGEGIGPVGTDELRHWLEKG